MASGVRASRASWFRLRGGASRAGEAWRRLTARRAVVVGLLLALTTASCATEGESPIPLPGGAPEGDFYRVTVEFTDVLDLVPEAAVKVNDVTVGSVERISLKGWIAQVVVRIDDDVRLPDNAVAGLRQTSLLGEKFVALSEPPHAKPQGRLSDGDVIPVSRTRRSVEVEEVLSAMSLILSGGGLEQLRTINKEIADALEGREADVKDTLDELNEFVGGLEEQKEDIVRAIEALDTLSARLAKERGTVAKALDAMDPGLEVLAEQREDLVAMLEALRQLGEVGTDVIRESREETVKVLQDLQPVLRQLVASGDNLPKALDYLLTLPIPEEATKSMYDNKGDPCSVTSTVCFVNLYITLDLDAQEILGNLVGRPGAPDPGTQPGGDDSSLDPELPGGAPGAANVRQGGLIDLLIGGVTRGA